MAAHANGRSFFIDLFNLARRSVEWCSRRLLGMLNLLDALYTRGHNAASSAAGGQTVGRTHIPHHVL